MMTWEIIGPCNLGELPNMVSDLDPRPAKQQFDAGYSFAGGWRHQEGFTVKNGKTYVLQYPGDPPMFPVAACGLRDETIIVYQYDYVAIFQKDGSFEICRMD